MTPPDHPVIEALHSIWMARLRWKEGNAPTTSIMTRSPPEDNMYLVINPSANY